MYPQQMNQMNQRYQMSNGINWVQGIEGAKAFQIMPSSNIVLMDSENDGIFYIKVSDNVGMCKLRVFKYEEIDNTPNQQQIDTSQFVTRAELQEIIANLKESRDEQSISSIKRKQDKPITTK